MRISIAERILMVLSVWATLAVCCGILITLQQAATRQPTPAPVRDHRPKLACPEDLPLWECVKDAHYETRDRSNRRDI